MFNGWEIPLIVLLALLFFGGKKLPELARGFGQSIRTFKEEVTKEEDTDVTNGARSTEKKDSDEQAKVAKNDSQAKSKKE